MSDEAIRRQRRWSAFYEEEGGLREMLGVMRATYFDRMSKVEPWQVAQIANLAIAAKIVTQLDAMVLDIIAEGKVAEAAERQAEKIQNIPDHKRRWTQGA